MFKKSFTKAMAICLALVMSVCIFSFVASATQVTDFTADTTGTITVSGVDATAGLTVTAYKIVSVNIDETTNQPADPMFS